MQHMSSMFMLFLRCYDIGGSDIGGSDIGGPDIGGFLATLEALSKKDIGGLATLEINILLYVFGPQYVIKLVKQK